MLLVPTVDSREIIREMTAHGFAWIEPNHSGISLINTKSFYEHEIIKVKSGAPLEDRGFIQSIPHLANIFWVTRVTIQAPNRSPASPPAAKGIALNCNPILMLCLKRLTRCSWTILCLRTFAQSVLPAWSPFPLIALASTQRQPSGLNRSSPSSGRPAPSPPPSSTFNPSFNHLMELHTFMVEHSPYSH